MLRQLWRVNNPDLEQRHQECISKLSKKDNVTQLFHGTGYDAIKCILEEVSHSDLCSVIHMRTCTHTGLARSHSNPPFKGMQIAKRGGWCC